MTSHHLVTKTVSSVIFPLSLIIWVTTFHLVLIFKYSFKPKLTSSLATMNI